MTKKRNFSFLARLALILNLLASASLILSYLSVKIDPSKYWIPAFFGLAYPFIVALNLLFLIFWTWQQKWLFLLSFLSIAVGYSLLLQTIAFNGSPKVPMGSHSKVLRVMTYNVHSFKRFGKAQDSSVRNAMLNIIRQENPDLLCLQEFYTRRKGVYMMRDSILRILKTHYYYSHPDDPKAFESVGVAIFSKYPLSNSTYVPFTQTNSVNGAIYVDVHLPEKKIRLFSIHLQSIRFDPADYQSINSIKQSVKSIQNAEPSLAPFKHIGNKLKWAFVKRSEQAKLIASKVKESPYAVIVAGDFNDPPVSFAFQTVKGSLQDCFQKQGRGFAKTYNGSFPNFQIDYILCDSLFHVLNYSIIKKELSDHYPVRSDLSY